MGDDPAELKEIRLTSFSHFIFHLFGNLILKIFLNDQKKDVNINGVLRG